MTLNYKDDGEPYTPPHIMEVNFMICPICEKGEIKDYADGTTHCNNKNCLMDYTPPVYGRGDLRKRQPLTGFPWLIYFLKCVWDVKPELIGVTGVIMIFISCIVWVWMTTRLLGGI